MSSYFEVNFDGIPAPFHNYGGLSFGNLASSNHGGDISRPREAALQALSKAKFLKDMGIEQAMLPPQLRPDFKHLRVSGYKGSYEEILKQLESEDPKLLIQLYSASSMWTANAATISPSKDCEGGKMHIVTANLASNFHRNIESHQTYRILRYIFDGDQFIVYPPLPNYLSDEGAANHMRFSNGTHVFVCGEGSEKFPSRQNEEASIKVAELLKVESAVFLKQNPAVVDKGVFHNDVIAVSNDDLLLYHEDAFVGDVKLDDIKAIEIKAKDLSVEDAVKTYFFNSQIVTKPDGNMAIIAPIEVEENSKSKALMDKIKVDASNSIDEIFYKDLRQSMRNGGGPACLRLRVMMNEKEKEIITGNANVFLTDDLYTQLESWINRNYREELKPKDLFDIKLYSETKVALTELSEIMRIPLI